MDNSDFRKMLESQTEEGTTRITAEMFLNQLSADADMRKARGLLIVAARLYAREHANHPRTLAELQAWEDVEARIVAYSKCLNEHANTSISLMVASAVFNEWRRIPDITGVVSGDDFK